MRTIVLAALLVSGFGYSLDSAWSAEANISMHQGQLLDDSAMENLRGGQGLNLSSIFNSPFISSALAMTNANLQSQLAQCAGMPSCHISINTTTSH